MHIVYARTPHCCPLTFAYSCIYKYTYVYRARNLCMCSLVNSARSGRRVGDKNLMVLNSHKSWNTYACTNTSLWAKMDFPDTAQCHTYSMEWTPTCNSYIIRTHATITAASTRTAQMKNTQNWHDLKEEKKPIWFDIFGLSCNKIYMNIYVTKFSICVTYSSSGSILDFSSHSWSKRQLFN